MTSPADPDPIDVVAFGVGSFFFEIPSATVPTIEVRNPKGVISGEEYSRRVRNALESIPSLEDVQVSEASSLVLYYHEPWKASPAWQPHDHGPHPSGPLIPHFADLTISFKAHIPYRVQSTFMGVAETEDFLVDIQCQDGFPVVFIHGEGLGIDQRPSASIVVVREFLRSEFRQRKEQMDGVIFCDLGPTPFHAECYVLSDEASSSEFRFDWKHSASRYSTLLMYYPPNDYSTADEAYQEIKHQIAVDLSEYYSFTNLANIQRDKWSYIDFQLSELARTYYSPGLVAAFRRGFLNGRTARRLSLEVLEAEADVGSMMRAAEAVTQQLEGGDHLPAFRDAYVKRVEGSSAAAPGRVREIVAFFDTMHSRTMNTVTVVVSSLLGGIVGAAITALASRGK